MNLKNIAIAVGVLALAYGAYYYISRKSKKTEIIKERGGWEIEVEVEDETE